MTSSGPVVEISALPKATKMFIGSSGSRAAVNGADPQKTRSRGRQESAMRSPNFWALLVSSVVTLVLLATSAIVGGQTIAYRAPSAPDGPPHLRSIWQALNTANWDIEAHAARPGPPQFGALVAAPAGLGVVDGEIPYQPSAAAKKKENFEQRWKEDPEAKCYLPGVPRANYMPFPFQIVQGHDKLMMVYENAARVRVIYIDQ